MKQLIYFCTLIVFVFCSCTKKTNVVGKVVSKNNTPIVGATVKLEQYKTSFYAISSTNIGLTDKDRIFKFSDKLSKRGSYQISCKTDTGKQAEKASKHVEVGKNTFIVLQLN